MNIRPNGNKVETEKSEEKIANREIDLNVINTFAIGFNLLSEKEQAEAAKKSREQLDDLIAKSNNLTRLGAFCKITEDLKIYKQRLEETKDPHEKALLTVHVEALTTLQTRARSSLMLGGNPSTMFSSSNNTNKEVISNDVATENTFKK